ncbi:MAG: tripartite tricarboxylate transporter substrate binding protein [Candidatus Accumulibacter sp.]|jgi:tripartite-type tricarboxylate transporter receptor subunit TctC|nr:tripartite tricarboxylate transporter substrate binding protein [Accumulibacter sp.]
MTTFEKTSGRQEITRIVRRFSVALIAVACAGLAQAQNYPSRPIRLIVPWPAGGGVDTSARIIAQPLSERLGQTIVIENKPGAAGNIGTALAAHEKPDGYTLLQASLSPNAVNPHLYKNLGFDPVKDFEPVALAYTVPSFLVVPANSPVNSAKELIEYAKANPGKLNFGSGGVGSSQHLFAVMLMAATGIDATHVAYKGTSPAEAALVAGQVDFMLDVPTCLPFVEAGKLKVLGVASPQRNSAQPNVPTLNELGIPVETLTFYGVMAPAKTPKEIVAKLNKEINAILQTPEVRSRLTKLAADPGTGSPEDFGKFVAGELERYGKIVKLSGAEKID